MSQLTLRQIPAEMEDIFRKEADKSGLSLNKTVINILKKALGLNKTKKNVDLSSIAGTWSAEEFAKFKKNTEHFDAIDEEIWK